jgi:O-antigen/teichoic acid export membrane protein
MGIVKKQAYKNTIVSYAGMVIAYINTVLLFPFFTTASDYGFYQLIISISVLYSLFASMGVPSILAKYFPHYRTEDRKHNGFIHWTALLALAGFIAATILFILFKPLILSAYIKTSPLFAQYYYYFIPLSLFVIVFNYFEMTGRVVYQTIYSNFLQNVLLRLLTTVFLLMIAEKWINFQDFIFLYIGSNGIISLLLIISIVVAGNFSFTANSGGFKQIKQKEILNFGLFTLITSAVYVLLQKVDTLMLSSMAGDAVQGVYSWYFNIAIVISVPAQALSRTTYAIVANAWQAKDMANIAEIYSKTSIIQMVVGSLLFIGIIINRENLYAVAKNKEYVDPKYFSLLLVIGFGFLVDITGGLNTYIISTSHKYRLITLFVFITSLTCIGLNYFLIPVYKGLGAAISYLICISILNFISWLYIKYRFNMQPFTWKHLLVIVIAGISYLAGYYFWRMPNVISDILIRSATTAFIYGFLTYAFHISDDLNMKIDDAFKKLSSLIK